MPEDTPDFQETMLNAILDDFADRTRSDASIVLDPLGDGIGWRATVITSNELMLGKASHRSVYGAIDLAVSRALDNLRRVLEADDEDDDADDRA